jgi:zinc protease
MANIPISREGVIDTALLVLHDWSAFVSLKDKDIEDERGVIREEWRTSNSGGRRMLEKVIFPIIYKGTPYANRLPIGSIDVINNFKYDELRDYYKKWYRPDLQGIFVVGDIDVDKIEAKIKELFSDIPTPVNPAERIYFQIPDNTEPIVAIASDPENSDLRVGIYWKRDAFPKALKSSLQYYKSVIIGKLIKFMMSSRLNELSRKSGRPFLSATVYMGDFFVSPSKWAWGVSGSPVSDDFEAALRAMLIENERMRRFGFVGSVYIILRNYPQ